MKHTQFKAYNVNRHLALAVADAAIALKREWWGRSSESLVMQAALVRFLSAVRPGCPHLARFLKGDHEMRDRIVSVAGMATVPDVEADHD